MDNRLRLNQLSFWEKREVRSVIPAKNSVKGYRFIDLFAGIGGIRSAFENSGNTCVFSSEWDKHCQATYKANFGEKPYGDITKINEKDIPDHDILLAGFPCQPFSVAGVSKKLSLKRQHGFADEEQGNLFFDIARIIAEKRPTAFMLENVKNLKSHDGGKTFEVIRNTLEDLGYSVHEKVIDAIDYVPQHRERIFIVGFDKKKAGDINFNFPQPPRTKNAIADILEKDADEKHTLSDKLWNYLQGYADIHKEKGNGFGFGLIDPETDTATRTLSARYYKDGSEILIKQADNNPRKLTPRECARLMGFDDSFQIPVSDTQAYKQFGNSVVVPVVGAVASQLVHALDSVYGRTVERSPKQKHVKNRGKKHKTRVTGTEIPAQQGL
ncbi:DNA (cytosine-5-)-methyltransferase [Candidatus Saccharibacteria bacterium QS_5_54_17]|nr:MAG: DNA (cytosine-5-)-methyltransferase [Candidatus Saccharibacteria bacterium QS_5_54_17]